MRKTTIFLLFLLFPFVSPSQDEAASVAHRLASVKVFAFGGIGFAGETSDGEKDFRIIYSQPHDVALKLFEELFKNGNPEAKSYALAGIRQVAPARFATLKQSLAGSSTKVVTMSGCIVEEKLLTSVADDIGKGNYDYWIKRR
ncbi:MAG: hypothetical protein ABR928_05365 [Terracidiphilus sp.]